MINPPRTHRSAALAALCVAALSAQAQIRTDGSLGRAAQSLPGPNFVIPESLGALRGANLFHSFSVFGIGSGESATFTTSTSGIANVISRVTGGEPSAINGLMRLAAADGKPGFFFINPAGVTFGAGAAIDVPGAFHVSTADYVRFADGRYYADASAGSTLSAAPPEAFGFLGHRQGLVAVTGGARLTTALLQPFSIVAGDVTLDNGRATTQGGDIRIVAIGGGAGEVALAGSLPNATGTLRIVNGGEVSAPVVGNVNGGHVSVSAGDILVRRGDSPTVTGILSQANTGTTGNAGGIEVLSSGTLRVLDGGVISSSTFSSGNAGSVAIRGGDIELDGRSNPVVTGIFSSANAGSSGNAGSVDIQASGQVSILAGANIASSAFSGARDGGTVTVRAGDLLIDRAGSTQLTGIFATAGSGSTGRAGNIDIALAGSLVVYGGLISSETFAAGDSGNIRVRAADIYVDRMGEDVSTGIFSQAEASSTGNAGNIDVAATGSLALVNGARISSSSLSSGHAGEVRVAAGDILVDSGTSIFNSGIVSSAESSGQGGSVFITASGSLALVNGATVASNSFSSGAAGSVDVRAANIVIDGGTFTDTVTGIASNAYARGRAGSVSVSASGLLTMMNGGQVSSSTFSTGNAGTVNVAARDIVVDGRASEAITGIVSQANAGSGSAGQVSVSASGSLTMLGNGVISSSTFDRGSAGSVEVNAGRISIDGSEATGSRATGIISGTYDEATGNAGLVSVTTPGLLSIVNGGEISSNTFARGNAGSVTVRAGTLDIDGRGNFAGIYSQALTGSHGNGGSVDVQVAGLLSLRDYAKITSTTFGPGNAGTVHVTAGSLLVDGNHRPTGFTGIASNTDLDATGNAGNVTVDVAGPITLRAGGEIASSTFTSGNSASVTVKAGDLTIDGTGECPPCTGIFSQAEQRSSGRAGQVDVTVTGDVAIRDHGLITTGTNNAQDAGHIRVQARNILVDGGGYGGDATGIVSNAIRDSGSAGIVDVRATGNLTILGGGVIGSSTFSAGNAGRVDVSAGSLHVEGYLSSLNSSASVGSSGNAGVVNVNVAGLLELLDGGLIMSSTFSVGDAGSVFVQARDILIKMGVDSTNTTGILSQAEPGSLGQGGSLDVRASGTLAIREGGVISSTTFSSGNAGRVHVEADRVSIDAATVRDSATGIVSLAARGTGDAGTLEVVAREIEIKEGGVISSSTYTSGNAGNIRVDAGIIDIDRNSVFADTGILSSSSGPGNAGRIEIAANDLILRNGGSVSSATFDEGDAGSVSVRARNVMIDGGPRSFPSGIFTETAGLGSGRAGSIDIVATESLTLARSGYISSSSGSYGPAGTVTVTAPDITLIGSPFDEFVATGIETRAGFYASAAGTVNVNATGRLRVLNGAVITASTSSFSGEAGSVFVTARDVLVDGRQSSINARAENFSRGQSGSVSVNATGSITVANGGEIAITNLMALPGPFPWTITPTLLSVTAPVIELRDGGTISAASVGEIPASNIAVHVGNRLVLDNASITTSAVDGNGGSIALTGQGVVVLRNSQITTSVTGLAGNGGDITIATRGLVMDTGFIQANTAADNAAGGNVNVNVAFLIPSGNLLFVGGAEPIDFLAGVFGLNVIQAAAPTGVSGAISITTPSLDVSAGLTALSARVLDDTGLGRSLCETSGGSALAQAGRGAMPPSARGFLRAEDPDFAAVADAGRWVPLTARITCAR